MFGRRSHLRFTISPASTGVLRVLNDVVIVQGEGDGLLAVSREPGIVGEDVAVQIINRHGTMNASMRIAESRPLVTNGAVRHQLRLERIPSVEPDVVRGVLTIDAPAASRSKRANQ